MGPFYFVTGGMGSLGREVVPRILAHEPSAEIVLLVRASDESDVRARMTELPITIFRPSIIVGDAVDGLTCNFATFCRALRMIAKGWIREIPAEPDSRLDIVTVDSVAEAIAELTIHPRRGGTVYHLVAGTERSVRIADLVAAASSCGHEEKSWKVTRLAAPRTGLSIFFDSMDGGQAFDDATTRVDLGPSAPRPAPPESYLPRMLAFCVGTDWGRDLPWEGKQWQPAA